MPMPLFRVTVKNVVNSNGVYLTPGMSVNVNTSSFANPVTTNGGQAVADAFMRIYGVDLRRANALTTSRLNVERIE